jgi:hypothetical protein
MNTWKSMRALYPSVCRECRKLIKKDEPMRYNTITKQVLHKRCLYKRLDEGRGNE